jgi:phosphatidylglycerol---prolipoprotein diacylglyceryl transferase
MYPVLFMLGWIQVPSFTALMALALGAGLALAWIGAWRARLLQTDVLDIALVAVLGGVLAARAVYVIMNWGYFRHQTGDIAQLWQGGLSWHGGFIGGVTGAAIASAWRKQSIRAVFDVLTSGLMAGAALGWIGCYLAGVAYGREVFPGNRWWFLAADSPDIYGLWNPRFSTQLLGAAWAALSFIVAWTMRQSRPGVRFAVTMVFYSAGVFVLGFARGDTVPMIGAWRVDQVMDAGIVVAAVAFTVLAKVPSLRKGH